MEKGEDVFCQFSRRALRPDKRPVLLAQCCFDSLILLRF